jgi:Tfp pilus assembly protein PilV
MPAAPHPFGLSPAHLRRRSGFTIMEVMLAAGIMALAISTSITTMQRAFLSLDAARNVTLASHLMQSELERMRLKNWETITSWDTASGHPAQPTTIPLDEAFASDPAIATRFSLTRESTVVRDGMRQITFTVSWRGYDGRVQSRSYTTYYGRNGLYDYFYNSS